MPSSTTKGFFFLIMYVGDLLTMYVLAHKVYLQVKRYIKITMTSYWVMSGFYINVISTTVHKIYNTNDIYTHSNNPSI